MCVFIYIHNIVMSLEKLQSHYSGLYTVVILKILRHSTVMHSVGLSVDPEQYIMCNIVSSKIRLQNKYTTATDQVIFCGSYTS